MTDIDRGAYAPQTDGHHLSFDARAPRRGGRKPAPFTLIFSGVVLVALVAAVAFFYRGGMREADQAPQTVGEPMVAMREAVQPEAEPADEAESLDVYVNDDNVAEATPVDAPPAFAPPPEQPKPRPAPKLAAAPVEVAQTPKPSLRPAQPAPPAAERAAQTTPTQTKPAPSQLAQIVPVQPAAPAAAPSAGGGSWGVQIGAFTSTSIADQEYAHVVGANPSFATGRSKVIQPVPGKNLYRTIVSGFSREQAAAFCAQLKSQGRDCIIRGAA